jgi:hypothetical protein
MSLAFIADRPDWDGIQGCASGAEFLGEEQPDAAGIGGKQSRVQEPHERQPKTEK